MAGILQVWGGTEVRRQPAMFQQLSGGWVVAAGRRMVDQAQSHEKWICLQLLTRIYHRHLGLVLPCGMSKDSLQ